MKSLHEIIEEIGAYKYKEEIILGYLRYESLRKLSPMEYTALYQRNLHGENFDEMVTKIVIEDNQ